MSTPEKTIKPGEEFPPGVEVLVEIEKCPEGVQNPFKKVKKIFIIKKKIGKSNKSNLSKRKSQKQRNFRRNKIRRWKNRKSKIKFSFKNMSKFNN